MNLIIYSNKDSNNLYGYKQIDLSLYKKLIVNKIHKKYNFQISKEKIEKELNIELNIDYDLINVIFMTELSESQLNMYLEVYEDEIDEINKYINLLYIVTFNQLNPDKFKIKKKFDIILSKISEYWEDTNNCNFTLTNNFIDRRFNNTNYITNIDNINDIFINKEKKIEIDWNSKEINYLNDLIRESNKNEMYIRKYNISNVTSLTKIDVIEIYKILPSEYMKYMFISNMLCSRMHCHLILNNLEFLELSKPIFEKYLLVFKYLIGYSWITLKNEEHYIYNKIKDTDRIVFDIDTANLLPVFPFTYSDINQNPYAAILLDKEVMDITHNCLSLDMISDYKKYYGLCNSTEFSRRLNIFINGTNVKGILNIIDWSCCTITGSVMTACGMKYNPLMDICKTNDNTEILSDHDLSNYFFHYYEKSDIDVICNKESIIDFINVVNDFLIKSRSMYGNTTISNVHNGSITISEEFILNELENIKKVLKINPSEINVQYIKTNLTNQHIKDYFYDNFYIKWKEEQFNYNINNNDNELIREYLKPVSRQEFVIYNL